jgi:hypothetical protein
MDPFENWEITAMDKVKIYRFRSYDIQNDQIKTSSRWGTREAIEVIARGEVIEESEREVDASSVQSDILGMTERNYDPDRRTGFQTRVR